MGDKSPPISRIHVLLSYTNYKILPRRKKLLRSVILESPPVPPHKTFSTTPVVYLHVCCSMMCTRKYAQTAGNHTRRKHYTKVVRCPRVKRYNVYARVAVRCGAGRVKFKSLFCWKKTLDIRRAASRCPFPRARVHTYDPTRQSGVQVR